MSYYKFTALYKVKTIARYAAMILPQYEAQIHYELKKQDPENVLREKLYPALKNLFVKICQNLSEHDCQAEILFDLINDKIVSQLMTEDMCRQFLYNKFVNEHPMFKNKSVMVKETMKRILEGDLDFSQIMLYNKNFDSFLQKQIKETIVQVVKSDDGKKWLDNWKVQMYDCIMFQIKDSFQQKEYSTLKDCLLSFVKGLLKKNQNNNKSVVLFEMEDFSTCNLLLDLES